MAFTALSTVTSTPGSYQILAGSTSVEQNFLLENLSVSDDDVELAGYLAFRLYVPNPVDKFGTVLSVPCWFQSNLFLRPLGTLTGLNCEVGFYSTKFKETQSIRLWVE